MENLYYELYHVYDNEDLEEVSKFIGVFSSLDMVSSVIDKLVKIPGFNKFSRDNFIISQSKLNEYEWKEGFCSWEQAD